MAEAQDFSDFSDEELSSTEVAFNKASAHVRTITTKLTENQLLELYGLYKQGTEGKCNTARPGFFNLQGKAKWDAWNNIADMPLEEAKQKYTKLVEKYDPDWTASSGCSKTGQKETWVTVSTHRYSPEPELPSTELSIIDAARDNCADKVSELLKKHPELRHEKDRSGLTALHWAADRDSSEALMAAIKGGCPVEAIDDCGQTALHYAASCGHIRSTQILLESGASPLVKDEDDATPIDLASDDEIRKLLVRAVK